MPKIDNCQWVEAGEVLDGWCTWKTFKSPGASPTYVLCGA